MVVFNDHEENSNIKHEKEKYIRVFQRQSFDK